METEDLDFEGYNSEDSNETDYDSDGLLKDRDEINYRYSENIFDEDFLIRIDDNNLRELFTELETAIENFENFEILSNIIDKNPKILNCYKEEDRGGILYNDKVINDINLMKFLVSKGANPMLRIGKYFRFLISKVCLGGYLEIVKFLYETISKFDNFKSENHMFKTLSVACGANNEDIIDFIHDKVSDEEIMDGLIYAIQEKHINTIRLLSPKYQNPKIFKHAIMFGNIQIIDILSPFYGQNLKLNCWKDDISPLQYSLCINFTNIFYHLLKYFDVESTDNFGRTSLFYINGSTDVEVIKYLMENSDLSHIDCKGDNAIMSYARKNRYYSGIKFDTLFSYKDRFDTTIRNAKGKTFEDIFNKYS